MTGINVKGGRKRGNMVIGQACSDTLVDGLGNDTFDGSSLSDTVSDWARYAKANNGVAVDLSIARVQDTGDGLDTLLSIEHLEGLAFVDVLTGSDDDNVLRVLPSSILSPGAAAPMF